VTGFPEHQPQSKYTMKKLLPVLVFVIFNHQLSAQNMMELSDKQIVKIVTIDQSTDKLWWQWTTHEGLKTFFGKDNKIEMSLNGAFEIYFLTDKPVGLKGSEGCKVLSYLPKKYFSFSWNAPPQFEAVRNSDYKTWVVVEFDPITDHKTRITLTHLGWPKDERWSPVFDYFSQAWEVVLNNLSKSWKDDVAATPTPKGVTGVGGIFFKCKDPDKMKEWYKTHLGLVTDKYGTKFEWRQDADPSQKGFTLWSPFKETTKYFEPSTRDFMINYRAENLVDLVEQLKKEGVTIVDKIETYEYGKFVHIMDIEGNKIELFEPIYQTKHN